MNVRHLTHRTRVFALSAAFVFAVGGLQSLAFARLAASVNFTILPPSAPITGTHAAAPAVTPLPAPVDLFVPAPYAFPPVAPLTAPTASPVIGTQDVIVPTPISPLAAPTQVDFVAPFIHEDFGPITPSIRPAPSVGAPFVTDDATVETPAFPTGGAPATRSDALLAPTGTPTSATERAPVSAPVPVPVPVPVPAPAAETRWYSPMMFWTWSW